MFNSIQQFQNNGLKRLSKVFSTYSEDFSKQAEMISAVKDEVLTLGKNIIREEWESYDELIRKRKELREGWYIVRKDDVTRKTSLGAITYSRTLFINKATGKRAYLPLAILLHMLGDTFAALYQKGLVPLWTVEVWVALWVAVTVAIAVKLYRNMKAAHSLSCA